MANEARLWNFCSECEKEIHCKVTAYEVQNSLNNCVQKLLSVRKPFSSPREMNSQNQNKSKQKYTIKETRETMTRQETDQSCKDK